MSSTDCPRPDEDWVMAGRARLLELVAARRVQRERSLRNPIRRRVEHWASELVAGLSPRPSSLRRLRSAAAATAATVVLAAGVVGVGTAAASSVPGEAFYSVKRIGETAQLMFTFDAATRARLNMAFADRRRTEMGRLAEAGSQIPQALIEDWVRRQASAWSEIRRLPAEQRDALAAVLLDRVHAGVLSDEVLRDAVARGTSLDILLGRSDELARAVRDALLAAAPVAKPDPVAEMPVAGASGPMAVPRPLPPGETRDPQIEDAKPVAPEPVVAPVEKPAAQPTSVPPVAAPVVENPNRPPAEDRGGASEPPVVENPTDSPPTDEPEPPGFGMPPVATATPTPSPTADPGVGVPPPDPTGETPRLP